MVLKIAWGITGAGDFLPDSIKIIREILHSYDLKLTVFLSQAGIKVVQMYQMWSELEQLAPKLLLEKDANTPFIAGPLQRGAYHILVVIPATANTVAKIAMGIADTLVTNAVAQALKIRVPTYIFPVDQKSGSITTILPSGEELTLTPRDIDLKNVEKLRLMEGISILKQPSDIISKIEHHIDSMNKAIQ